MSAEVEVVRPRRKAPTLLKEARYTAGYTPLCSVHSGEGQSQLTILQCGKHFNDKNASTLFISDTKKILITNLLDLTHLPRITTIFN